MTDTTQGAAKPRTVLYAAIALLVSGASAMIGGLSVLGNKDWVRSTRVTALNKIIGDSKKSAKDIADAKKNITPSQLDSYVHTQVKASVIGCIVTLLLCAFLAYAVYKGRHWARWGVIGVWVLSTLTGSFVSLFLLLGFVTGKGIPSAVRVPVVLAGTLFLVALVMVNLRPSVEFFALTRPNKGAPRQVRSGLFGPKLRVPQTPTTSLKKNAGTTPAARRAASARSADVAPSASSSSDRPRTKQRATADSVAKGADLARSRAKAASKSRRTGT